MKILKTFENFQTTKANDVLVVVDVQKEFDKFIPKGFVQKLNDYCRRFENVHQIYDINLANKPSYDFPNQKSVTDKRFGSKWFDGYVKQYIDTFALKTNMKLGQLFKLEGKEEYIVYTGNNHKWFFINERLVKMLNKLKGKNVVLVGGASGECLTDFEYALKAFGAKVTLNREYVYSAKTSNKQSVYQTQKIIQ